jgi:acetylcholinesterase
MASLPKLLFALLQLQHVIAVYNTTIGITSDPVTGGVNQTTPTVAHHSNIPFAEPPTGKRRWLPPVPKSREEGIDATRFVHVCPQFIYGEPSIQNNDAPESNIPLNTVEKTVFLLIIGCLGRKRVLMGLRNCYRWWCIEWV